MQVYFDSRNKNCKTPFGAIKAGDIISLVIAVEHGIFIDHIDVEMVKHGEAPAYYRMEYAGKRAGKHYFKAEICIESEGIYRYRFIADTENGAVTLGRGADNLASEEASEYYQQTVTTADYSTPVHMKGGIIYHIFVDRFNIGGEVVPPEFGVLKSWNEDVTVADDDGIYRANDFYGGNLAGIIEKLDYIKDLGVTLIYLSPIFKSSSNHRYDTGDYMRIDPVLGDEHTLIKLVSEAEKRGIGIMLDGVFNHTGADSLYFNKFNHYDSVGAYQGLRSPYFDWYHFINFPNEYACWWGITVTPTVNKMINSYRRFIMGPGGVLDKWTSYGIKGWRLDVVDELDKDFVTGIRNVLKAKSPEIAVIGEVWEDASTKVAYGTMRPYLLGYQLDGVMNYPFKEAIIGYVKSGDAAAFIAAVMTIAENYPKESLDSCMTLLDSHDTVRILNVLSDAEPPQDKRERVRRLLTAEERKSAIVRMKIAVALQYFLPGAPSIYYGDELGMEGWDDPINRRPMAWESGDSELLDYYRTMGKLRAAEREVFAGDFTITGHNGAIRIDRSSDEKTISLLVNASDNPAVFNICGIDMITGRGVKRVNLTENSFRIIKISR